MLIKFITEIFITFPDIESYQRDHYLYQRWITSLLRSMTVKRAHPCSKDAVRMDVAVAEYGFKGDVMD